MERRKSLLRAKFYHEEAEKLRVCAAAEERENRRKIILEIAESYEATAKMLIEGSKGIRRK